MSSDRQYVPNSSFEKLRIWHDARRLTRRIYELTAEQPFRSDFSLRDQMRRAMLSVMSNIAEGYEREGRKELLYFLRVAKGSAAELRSQLYAAEDLGYATPERAALLRREVLRLTRQIAAFANSAKA